MAEIVLVMGYSHTPYLFAQPAMWSQVRDKIRKGKPLRSDLPRENEAELHDKYVRSMSAFGKLSQSIHQSQADTLVVLGDDQKEIFSSIVTGFTVYTGSKVAGKKWPGRVREVNGNHEAISIENQQSLAQDIVNGMANEGFDIAFFDEPENKEDGFGHAFLPPLNYLTPTYNLPVVPILVNCYYPPQPTAQRCFDFGRALKKILQKTTSCRRVAVTASGGLWHTPGKDDASIDELFDKTFLTSLTANHWDTIAQISDAHLQSGTGEIRNWIVAAGITENMDMKWSVLDYIPLYYSPIGLGFAECKMTV